MSFTKERCGDISELDRLREVLLGTLKNKYGSLAHSFAEMDVNQSAIVDADVSQWDRYFWK